MTEHLRTKLVSIWIWNKKQKPPPHPANFDGINYYRFTYLSENCYGSMGRRISVYSSKINYNSMSPTIYILLCSKYYISIIFFNNKKLTKNLKKKWGAILKLKNFHVNCQFQLQHFHDQEELRFLTKNLVYFVAYIPKMRMK